MQGFWTALTFLTRLPAPGRGWAGTEQTAHAVTYFPLVGAVIGVVVAAVGYLTQAGLRLPELAGSMIMVAVWTGITGGLHLDGLIDTADGFAAGTDREVVLRVMRDHRTGAMGVIAAVLVLLWKWAMTAALINKTVPAGYWIPALILAPTWSRWAMTLVITAFPYARPSGLAQSLSPGSGRGYGGPALTAFVVSLVVFLIWRPPVQWLAAICLAAALVAWSLGSRWCKRLGGLTGDTYGAINELVEATVLVVAVIGGGGVAA